MTENLSVVTEDLVTFVQQLTDPNPGVVKPEDGMPTEFGMEECTALWGSGYMMVTSGVACLTKVAEGFQGYKAIVMACHNDYVATDGQNTAAILTSLNGGEA